MTAGEILGNALSVVVFFGAVGYILFIGPNRERWKHEGFPLTRKRRKRK